MRLPFSRSPSAALQSIAGQEQENKCALCTCVCLSTIPAARDYISECSFGSAANESGGEKKLPKVWRKDPTSLVRNHKLFVVCSSLKHRGSSQVDGVCEEGSCWRKNAAGLDAASENVES